MTEIEFKVVAYAKGILFFQKTRTTMSIENILIWIVLGAIAGFLAGKILKGKGFGLVGNIIVGIVGSFFGGWLAGVLNIGGAVTGGISIPSILTAVGGAVVLLLLISFFRKAA